MQQGRPTITLAGTGIRIAPEPKKFRICKAETLRRGAMGWIVRVPRACNAPCPEYWCSSFGSAVITMDGIIEAHVAAAQVIEPSLGDF